MENKKPRDFWLNIENAMHYPDENCNYYPAFDKNMNQAHHILVREVMPDGEFERGEKEGFKKAIEMLRFQQKHQEGKTIVDRPFEFLADWLEGQMK